MAVQYMPRIVIAAPKGRTGKTTFTLGFLAAITGMGLKAQPFKKGPDFIDPSWMTKVTGRDSHNLDAVLMSAEAIRQSVAEHSQYADIAVVEGAMGLYDGLDIEGSGSTAQIAKILQAPVLLVLDCTRMTRSAAAMVMGYQHFDRDVKIAGVILNKVGSRRHERLMREAITRYCGIPVLGSIPKDDTLSIPDRHLGLIPANEQDEFENTLKKLAQVITEKVDLPAIISLAQKAESLDYQRPLGRMEMSTPTKAKVNIGVVRDRAFSFYYPENLQKLENMGAHLVILDSLADQSIGEVDGLYLGGGFPEMFGLQLEKNKHFRHSIFKAVNNGLPVYAECGGLMYLGRKIIFQGDEFAMVGVLPFDVVMEKKPQGHGYTVMNVVQENGYFNLGDTIRGHEFHHSKLINIDESKIMYALSVQRGTGIEGRDGIIYKNVFAAYNHIHAISTPQWAVNFVEQARQYCQRREKSII